MQIRNKTSILAGTVAAGLLAVVAGSQIVSGSGSGSSVPGARTSVGNAQPGQNVTRHILASRAQAFHSLSALARGSEVIAVATPTDTRRVETLGDIDWTVTTVRIDRVLRGQAPTTVELRQLGAPNTSVEGQPLVRPNQQYLLFLNRFTRVAGDQTGQWVVTGAVAGIYVLANNNRYDRTDAESPDLPPSMTESDARSAGSS